MKRYFKYIFSLICSFVLIINAGSFVMTASAANKNTNSKSTIEIVAEITDEITGEKTPVEADIIKCSVKSVPSRIPSDPSVESFTATTIAKYKIPNNRDTEPGGKITNEVVHVLNIDYDYKKVSGDHFIRMNRVYGSWTPIYSYIFLSNREVHYGDGEPFTSQFAHNYPTTNTFNYNTGWDWTLYYPEDYFLGTGPRAFSSASISVSGMSYDTHTISALTRIFINVEA